MDEHLFLKGQRVITSNGDEAEVIDSMGDKITIKLDDGSTAEFPSTELTDNSSAG